MKIREATRADARQIVGIFHDTIHTVNTQDYTSEQVNAWSPAVPDADEWAERKFPNRTTFLADDDGTIAGFGELENNGHVDCFYCHHAYQRRGVGSAIFRRIEEKARILGLTRLFTEASITAKPFFSDKGFTAVKQQTVISRGVELTNFVMEKALTANKASRPTLDCRMETTMNSITCKRASIVLAIICIVLAITCYRTLARFNAVGYYIVDFVMPQQSEPQVTLHVKDKGEHCYESWKNGNKLDLIADRRRKPKVLIKVNGTEVTTIELVPGRSEIDVSKVLAGIKTNPTTH